MWVIEPLVHASDATPSEVQVPAPVSLSSDDGHAVAMATPNTTDPLVTDWPIEASRHLVQRLVRQFGLFADIAIIGVSVNPRQGERR